MPKKEISEFVKGVERPSKGFEEQWLEKFRKCLDETVGEEMRKDVMNGSEKLAGQANSQRIIDWTREAMSRLDSVVSEEKRKKIMTGCACHFPEQRLLSLRAKYAETKDVDAVQKMLRETFISDLKNGLKLGDKLIRDIVGRG